MFESLVLYHSDSIIKSPGSSIHWLKDTDRLRKYKADIQMAIEDTTMALYDKKFDRTTTDEFMEKVEKVNDLKFLAKPLRREFELLTSGRVVKAEK